MKLKTWFDNTTFYAKFRHYFIRRKSPVSYILWSEILRRDLSYCSGILTPFVPRSEDLLRIETSIESGAPRDNKIEFSVYDDDGKYIRSFQAKLTYRDSQRIRKAAEKANYLLLELNDRDE